MNAEEKLLAGLDVRTAISEVEVRGGVLRSVVAGEGEDLLLLHGINMGWGAWYPNIAVLAQHFRVHALDLPGAGKSMKVHPFDKNFDHVLVGAVSDYLDQRGIKKAHLVGHSLGAWVALNIALARPDVVEKIVLASPLGFTRDTPLRSRLLGLRWLAIALSKTVMRPTRGNIESFLRSVVHDPAAISVAFVDYYHECLARGLSHPFLFMNRIAGVRWVRKEFYLSDRMNEIHQPVLVIAGRHDHIVSFTAKEKRAFASWPNITLQYFEESGHVPSMEQTDLFNRIVIAFLT